MTVLLVLVGLVLFIAALDKLDRWWYDRSMERVKNRIRLKRQLKEAEERDMFGEDGPESYPQHIDDLNKISPEVLRTWLTRKDAPKEAWSMEELGMDHTGAAQDPKVREYGHRLFILEQVKALFPEAGPQFLPEILYWITGEEQE